MCRLFKWQFVQTDNLCAAHSQILQTISCIRSEAMTVSAECLIYSRASCSISGVLGILSHICEGLLAV